MAHVGQELALGLARAFGRSLGHAQLLLAVAQRLLGQRALRGVEEDGVDADDLALVVDIGHVAAGVPHRVAGAVDALALERHRLAGQRLRQVRLDVGPQLGADDIAHMAAENLVLAFRQPDFLGVVDVAVVACGVDVRHRHRDLIHDRAHAALGAPRRVERALLLRHVHRQQAQAAGAAGRADLVPEFDLQRLSLAARLLQGAAQARRVAVASRLHRRGHGSGECNAEGLGHRRPTRSPGSTPKASASSLLTATQMPCASAIAPRPSTVRRSDAALSGACSAGAGRSAERAGTRARQKTTSIATAQTDAGQPAGRPGTRRAAEVEQQRQGRQRQHQPFHAAHSSAQGRTSGDRSNTARPALSSCGWRPGRRVRRARAPRLCWQSAAPVHRAAAPASPGRRREHAA